MKKLMLNLELISYYDDIFDSIFVIRYWGLVNSFVFPFFYFFVIPFVRLIERIYYINKELHTMELL